MRKKPNKPQKLSFYMEVFEAYLIQEVNLYFWVNLKLVRIWCKAENDSKSHLIYMIENPSFLTVNRKKDHLYAISEVDNSEVVCFGIDHQEKKIHEINPHFTKGGPCYVELGANEDYIFTANYGGGSIVVHALNENGEIEKETDFITYQSKKGVSAVIDICCK